MDEVEDGDMVMGEVARVVGLIETLPTVRTLMHLKMEWVVRQLKDVDMVGLVVVVAVGVVSMMEKMLKGNALVEHLNATVELAVEMNLNEKGLVVEIGEGQLTNLLR